MEDLSRLFMWFFLAVVAAALIVVALYRSIPTKRRVIGKRLGG
jgi:hypothetical protein